MKIINKGEGRKIDYVVEEKRITFNDDVSINLAKREKDSPVHIDLCYTADKALVIDSASGIYYAAQIDIPARAYEMVTVKRENPQTGEEEDAFDRRPLPLDMDNVVLTLWDIDGFIK